MTRILSIIIIFGSLGILFISMNTIGTINVKNSIISTIGIIIAIYIWLLDRSHRKHIFQFTQKDIRNQVDLATQVQDTFTLDTFDSVLATVKNNFTSLECIISLNVKLSETIHADLIASHLEPSITVGTPWPVFQHFVMCRTHQAKTNDFNALFDATYQYVRQTFGGSVFNYRFHVILPCITTDTADPDIITFASGKPPKRWMKFELPVLYELSTGRTYLCRETPALGRLFFPGACALAQLAFTKETLNKSPPRVIL